MVTLLEQFRVHYPKGRLIADLISLHEGQYVVRAAILNDGETLATGLAASVDVQIAEDRARERAIAALVITTHPASDLNTVQAVAAVAIEKTPEKAPEETPKETPEGESELLLDLPPDLRPDEEDLGPPIDAIEESLEPENSEEASAPDKPSAAAIALENFSTSAAPVDLSDVIAQTDVELTRLGWTNEQGREYLEKTYGKRSRQQLTDDELMSFLLYLEEQ